MSKSQDFQNALLAHIFLNEPIANVGDATGLRGSVAPGSLYVAMHTSDPGEAGSAITGETAYGGYVRRALERSTVGFTRTGSRVRPTNNVDFPMCSSNPGSPLTFFSIVTTASGAGMILYSGALTPNINVAIGIVPRLKSTTYISED
jgi:hypothetical protein